MATQTVRYIVEINNGQAVAALKTVEGGATSAERAISNLNVTLGSLGLGLGMKAIADYAKDAVDEVAKLETSFLRIKNASANFSEGVKNQLFIRDEVNRFKIDLQESADAWGKFLMKTRNAGLGSGLTRKLHDELLTISKVSALPESEMTATINNIGILLTEKVLEARHIRGLSYVHPQLMPFLASAMKTDLSTIMKINDKNISDDQAQNLLYRSLSSGKLTKAALDSKVLIQAIHEYYESVKDGLPETLDTIGSNMTDLHNKWLEFKESIVMSFKPEILSFIGVFKDWATTLKEHSEEVKEVIKVIFFLGKAWLAYKTAVFATTAINRILLLDTASQTASITKESMAIGGLNAELRLLNMNLEMLIVLQAQATVGANALSAAQAVNLATYAGLNAKNLPINMAGTYGTGAAAGALSSKISSAIMGVFIVGMAAEVANQFLIPKDPFTKEGVTMANWGNTIATKISSSLGIFGDDGKGVFDKAREIGIAKGVHKNVQADLDMYLNDFTKGGFDIMTGKMSKPEPYYKDLNPKGTELFDILHNMQERLDAQGTKFNVEDLMNPKDETGKRKTLNESLYAIFKNFGFKSPFLGTGDEVEKVSSGTGHLGGESSKIKPPNDRVRGAHAVTYNINIEELNGQKIGTQQVTGDKGDTEVVALKLRDIIISIVNDSQIRASN